MKTVRFTVEEVCPDIHIDMAMPVGYASTELVHQFALWSRLERQSISTVCRPESVHQPHVGDRKETGMFFG